MISIDEIYEEVSNLRERVRELEMKINNIPVEDMDLKDFPFSTRTHTCLHSENINKLSQLLELTENDILRIKNLGKVCLLEIKRTLRFIGYKLKY